MEKTNTMGISSPKKWRKKTRFFCRTLAIAWIAVIFTPLTLAAQEQKVSINVVQADISLVFQQIKEQTGLNFMYNTEQLKGLSPVTLHVANGTVEEALKKLFAGQPFEWQYDDNYIIIKKKEVKPQESIKFVTITGVVHDEKKQSLPGVTVQVKGAGIGAATDVNGHYRVTVPMVHDSPFSLLFSFVGYETQEVKYIGQDIINVILKEAIHNMSEVVVTGYGDVARGNYTGSATTIQAKDIMMDGVSSIDQMLQGVVPGMLVMNKTGLVGASPKIRVRGTSTLLGSQDPVWVVDGVIQRDPQPFNSEDNTKFSMDPDDIKELAGNAISWLNPNDIETITVLKDASATAIYGSQAANGVIVITTKKATAGRVQVNYSGSFTIGQRPRYGLYDLMNSAERMQLSKDVYTERRYDPANVTQLSIGFESLLERYRNKEATIAELQEEYNQMARQNTDWFDILFRNSFNHSHNISVSGGSEKIQSRASLSFSKDNGEARGNSATHFSAVSNTTINWERLSVNLSLNGSVREVSGFAYGVSPFDYAYETSRVIPCYNEDGTLYYHEKWGTTSLVTNRSAYNYNILNEKEQTGSKSKTRTWGTTLDLRWKIVPDLEYQGLLGYTSSSADTKQWATERSFYITQMRGYEYGAYSPTDEETTWVSLPRGGILETDLTNVSTITVRNSLVYNKLFKDKHRVTLQLGIETNSAKTTGESNLRYGYMPERGESFVAPPSEYGRMGTSDNTAIAQGSHTVVNQVNNTLSEYGMAVYAYDDRYVLNVSGRVDASNRFGQDKNKRFQPTWSVGLKWRVGNEAFAKDKWWANNLDVYGSYGYQGNAVSTVSPYLITRFANVSMYDGFDTQTIVSVPYPDLGWEKTKTWNVGLTASFLNGRVNVTFDCFRKTSQVLSSQSIPFENGASNGIVSGTTMKNSGYDLVVNLVPLRLKDFTWQLSVNTSVANNKVESERVNSLSDFTSGSCLIEGRPFSTFYSYIFTGLDEEYGHPIFQNIGDQENVPSVADITGILEESGKKVPDFSGGFNMMFKYKNLSLYALFALQWGGHDRLPNLYPNELGGLPKSENNFSRKIINRWKQPGDNTDIPSLPGTGNEHVYVPAVENPEIAYQGYAERYELYNLSNIRVAKTDFIRCRSLSLTYDVESDWMKQAGINYLSLKASMTNPFMWVADKKWDGLDPETADWPTRRMTSFSIQVMF